MSNTFICYAASPITIAFRLRKNLPAAQRLIDADNGKLLATIFCRQ